MSEHDCSEHEVSSAASSNGPSRNPQIDNRNTSSDEIELATRLVHIQHKRFYLDVKQNRRGRFIKIAEFGVTGRKSRLLLASETAFEFRNHLTSFSEHCSSLGPVDQDQVHQDEKLKTESIVRDNRLYYLDLKENDRGRYLRVSQIVSRGPGTRSQIAIPAQGLIEFRDALSELLVEYMIRDDSSGNANKAPQLEPQLPEDRHMKVDRKLFFFDIRQNDLGIYMRVSEVIGKNRSALTIPEKSWTQFRDTFTECIDKMNEIRLSKSQNQQVPAAHQKVRTEQQ